MQTMRKTTFVLGNVNLSTKRNGAALNVLTCYAQMIVLDIQRMHIPQHVRSVFVLQWDSFKDNGYLVILT